VDVRIVAATNRDLKAAVAARQFREDLYFRLSVFPIRIPPLRERPGDIPMLTKYFVERYCRDLNKRPLAISASAEHALLAYSWPGNVRELQNCIERAVILTEGDTIHARHLNLAFDPNGAADAAQPDDPWDRIDLSGSLQEALQRVVAEAERRKIAGAMKDASGNPGLAADTLRINFRTLQAKLKDLGIS
jgi:transcriptional regulator with GAF, ATPase, and Fis domain